MKQYTYFIVLYYVVTESGYYQEYTFWGLTILWFLLYSIYKIIRYSIKVHNNRLSNLNDNEYITNQSESEYRFKPEGIKRDLQNIEKSKAINLMDKVNQAIEQRK